MTVDRRRVLGAGVQLERTRLAWSRTALGFAIVGALAFRRGIESHTSVLASIVGGLLILGTLGANAYGVWAYGRRAAELRSGRPIVRTAALRATSALIGLSVLAIVVVLL